MPKTKNRLGKIHAIIPDCQVSAGTPTEHLKWVGAYLAEKQPDVIVCIGDFADMPSLNSHARKFELEGKRYQKDVDAARKAMDLLMTPIHKVRGYNPDLILTLGNHEDRITRVAEENPHLMDTISIDDLCYEDTGWAVYPFLEVVTIDGIEYSHYFVSGAYGRPVSSAAALLRIRQNSAVMGHAQATDIAFHRTTGKVGIFAGICYTHSERYLTPQMNSDRRQIVFLNEVRDGTGDPMLISLGFLKNKFS